MKTTIFTKEQSLLKVKHYCGYQQRCEAEVREKLYSFNLNKKVYDEIILQLIQENYLNDEEFALQFARGKFRMKQWGRIKIKYALKQKQVSDNFIKNAVNQIDQGEYEKTINKLIQQKLKALKGINIFEKRKKLYDYLLQKGYEGTQIKEVADKADS
ncbi:MAG: regulatory protein RecX [Ginsengibacter sp.]